MVNPSGLLFPGNLLAISSPSLLFPSPKAMCGNSPLGLLLPGEPVGSDPF